jgi:hypothetical protein
MKATSNSPGRQYRPLLLIGWVCAWLAWIFIVMAAAFSWFDLGGYGRLIIAIAVPLLGIPVPLAILNLAAFPLPYSVFGRLDRTPLPKTDPVLVIGTSWGAVGGAHSTWPLVTWRVYSTGIGIQMWGTGSVFLPLAAITSVEFGYFSQCIITHSWHELRSPVKGPAAIGKMVEAALGNLNGLAESPLIHAPNA